jgi:hypothetical protein
MSHCGTPSTVTPSASTELLFVAYRSCPDFIPRFTISRSFGLAAHAFHMRPPSLFATSTVTVALFESRTLPRFSPRTLVFRRASSGHSFQGDSPRFPRETARSSSSFNLCSSRASAPPVLRLVLWLSVGASRSSSFQSAGVSVGLLFFHLLFSRFYFRHPEPFPRPFDFFREVFFFGLRRRITPGVASLQLCSQAHEALRNRF